MTRNKTVTNNTSCQELALRSHKFKWDNPTQVVMSLSHLLPTSITVTTSILIISRSNVVTSQQIWFDERSHRSWNNNRITPLACLVTCVYVTDYYFNKKTISYKIIQRGSSKLLFMLAYYTPLTYSIALSHQTSDVHTMLVQCWPIVYDAGPTLYRHWVTLGSYASFNVRR